MVNFGVLIKLHILISLLFIWEFRTEDRGGCGRLHRHIKKEEEKEITISLIMFEQPGQLNLCNELEAKSIKFVLLTTRYVNCLCAVFYGAILMNNSQTLLLRFKNNIQSAYIPSIPENTET